MKRNILFISHSASIMGAERCLLDLIKGLDQSLYSGLVITPYDGPLRDRVLSYGWDAEVFLMPWWVGLNQRSRWHFQDVFVGMPQRLKYLREIIRRQKIDLVYTNTITCIDGAVIAKLEHLPHVWHIHEIPSRQSFLKFYFPVRFLPAIVDWFSTRIIVPSQIARDDIQWRNNDKIEVVNNGIDLKNFDNSTVKNLRDKLNIKATTKIICMIGAINENKGQIYFIEAAHIVSKEVKDTIFLIVGSGNQSYLKLIKEKIHALSLTDKIFLLGFRNDIVDILNSVDIVVSASRSECFPLTLLEAMASSKPVVATMSGGPEEQVKSGETGLLVPYGEPQKLAEAIVYLLLNESRAREMGRKGRERVEKLYSIEKYVNGIEGVMNRCFQN